MAADVDTGGGSRRNTATEKERRSIGLTIGPRSVIKSDDGESRPQEWEHSLHPGLLIRAYDMGTLGVKRLRGSVHLAQLSDLLLESLGVL